ncbi:uncharacterized protein LACBIDRAFT_327182 [Laccaria bicolor S238N-H82]|uniref:Predicted protein n=1 Tax=Laccaria bicolor (strain S238N-H82 / ATCC MYA-4686) TaxID=486041 RepID=B0DBE7_LACBS|nr:uncharacterized protein LACBIDRAFT_327182 [Laccaria bicolor S238N-H82]EDR07979.1 predicted protein [Laccaria bicolor S238N-H82]|eukprot:XP_001881049.1 predicted protein [Laccaria bicolor S238N-H82]
MDSETQPVHVEELGKHPPTCLGAPGNSEGMLDKNSRRPWTIALETLKFSWKSRFIRTHYSPSNNTFSSRMECKNQAMSPHLFPATHLTCHHHQTNDSGYSHVIPPQQQHVHTTTTAEQQHMTRHDHYQTSKVHVATCHDIQTVMMMHVVVTVHINPEYHSQ